MQPTVLLDRVTFNYILMTSSFLRNEWFLLHHPINLLCWRRVQQPQVAYIFIFSYQKWKWMTRTAHFVVCENESETCYRSKIDLFFQSSVENALKVFCSMYESDACKTIGIRINALYQSGSKTLHKIKPNRKSSCLHFTASIHFQYIYCGQIILGCRILNCIKWDFIEYIFCIHVVYIYQASLRGHT